MLNRLIHYQRPWPPWPPASPAPCPRDEGIRCPNLGKPAWSLEPGHCLALRGTAWHCLAPFFQSNVVEVRSRRLLVHHLNTMLIMYDHYDHVRYSNLFNTVHKPHISRSAMLSLGTTMPQSFFWSFLPVPPMLAKRPPVMRSQTGRREWTKRPAQSAWPPKPHFPTLNSTQTQIFTTSKCHLTWHYGTLDFSQDQLS